VTSRQTPLPNRSCAPPSKRAHRFRLFSIR